MGYKPSDPIDFDFLMAVPGGGLNPQSIYNVLCVLHKLDNLHSIGITTIQQLSISIKSGTVCAKS